MSANVAASAAGLGLVRDVRRPSSGDPPARDRWQTLLKVPDLRFEGGPALVDIEIDLKSTSPGGYG
jgi:hypothetical protein